jgi:hypothetical protein
MHLYHASISVATRGIIAWVLLPTTLIFNRQQVKYEYFR